MAGGGVIVGLIIEIGLSNFALFLFFNNYVTIMPITGAIIRKGEKMQAIAILGIILAFVVISLRRLETEENVCGKCDL